MTELQMKQENEKRKMQNLKLVKRTKRRRRSQKQSFCHAKHVILDQK